MFDPHAEVTAPDVDEVRRIAAIDGRVLRNLAITNGYWRLSVALARRTGVGANWCTFATWASRQAGRTIRGEDALALLQARLGADAQLLHPIASLWRWLLRRGLLDRGTRLGRFTGALHTPFDALERASDAVARGNLKVFEEIALEFARFMRDVPPGASSDGPELRAFLDRLRPGDPPDGQRYLRQAFQRYQRLPDEREGKARTELLVLANLEIGFHEQTRLQPEIREALDAPYLTKTDLGFRLLDAVLPPGTLTRRAAPDRVLAPVLGAIGSRLQRSGAQAAREVITESLMVLSVPGQVLALGRHLADPMPDTLATAAHPELVALLARFEPLAPAPDDSGARDWSELQDRMHYIAHLFRALHERADLFDAPFTEQQIASVLAGRIPEGTL